MNDVCHRRDLYKLVLLFTGHMADAPDRSSPRFPPQMEPLAARCIRSAIRKARARVGPFLFGIASGARGGDILFHEICQTEGIATHLVLPFDKKTFLVESVRGAATGDWENRFQRLWNRLRANNRTVLDLKNAKDPFGACNEAMLSMAGDWGEEAELLALWDGAKPVLPGGTAAFVEQVRALGGQVSHIDSTALLADLTERRYSV